MKNSDMIKEQIKEQIKMSKQMRKETQEAFVLKSQKEENFFLATEVCSYE